MPKHTWSAEMPDDLHRQLDEQVGDESKSQALRRVVREYFEQRNRRLVGVYGSIVGMVVIALWALVSPSAAVTAAGVAYAVLVLWGIAPFARDLKRSPTELPQQPQKPELDETEV